MNARLRTARMSSTNVAGLWTFPSTVMLCAAVFSCQKNLGVTLAQPLVFWVIASVGMFALAVMNANLAGQCVRDRPLTQGEGAPITIGTLVVPLVMMALYTLSFLGILVSPAPLLLISALTALLAGLGVLSLRSLSAYAVAQRA